MRTTQSFNTGSMADIAFTLLIFFIVSTTLADDKGVNMQLPAWSDCTNCEQTINPRNLFKIEVKTDGTIQVKEQSFNPKKLKEEVINFLTNNGKETYYSDNYEAALVLIQIDKDAPYETYLEAFSATRSAFTEVRNQYSQATYGVKYDQLNKKEAQTVRRKFPLKLAEQTVMK